MSEKIFVLINNELKNISDKLEYGIKIDSYDLTSVQEETNNKLDTIINLLKNLCEIETDGISASSLLEHLRDIQNGLGEINERVNNIEKFLIEK